MKVAAVLLALVAAVSPVVASAELPKIIAMRAPMNMTTTTVRSTSSRSLSTSVITSTMGPGGGGSGSGGSGGGGSGMAGDAVRAYGPAIGASALALAGVVGALAVGL